MKGIKGQAVISALFAALTRGMGLILRLVMSRLLGAEVLGLGEMALSVQQLLCTPLTGGLPLAVSRLTALEKEDQKGRALYTARKMAWKRGMAMGVLCLAGAPFFAKVLGDMRIVPALLCFAPALPVISVCCVMDGCAFGLGRAFSPALSELTEQIVRLFSLFSMMTVFSVRHVPFRAALPVLSGVLGELAGLLVMMAALRGFARPGGDAEKIGRQLDRLSLPMIASRMGMSALRSVNGLLLPRLLMLRGLTAAQSASQLGLLQGMAMPLLFLPGILTGALSSLGGPRMAAHPDPRRLACKLILLSLLAGLLGTGVLTVFAPFIGEKLYHQAELIPLLRRLAPGCALIALNHILSAMLTGLGRQKQLFMRQMAGGLFSLLCTAACTLTGGIYGAARAVLLHQGVMLLLQSRLLYSVLKFPSSACSEHAEVL